MKSIKCPHCNKFYFIYDEFDDREICPHCGKDSKPNDELFESLKDMFGL